MDYDVRFCTSADGTRIAYAMRAGNGTPTLFLFGWPFALEAIPMLRGNVFELSYEHGFICMDRRGIGRSERKVEDISLDRQVEDVIAVVEASGMVPLNIDCVWDGAPVAIALAALRPELVHRMVMHGPYARGADIISRAALEATVELARTNWALTRRSIAAIGGHQGETAEIWMEMLRRNIAPEMAARYLELYGTIDATAYLHRVEAPCLVIYRPRDGAVPRAATEFVASQLSNCQLAAVHSRNDSTNAVGAFLWPSDAAERAQETTGTAIILFADIVDSTALTERLGDTAFREKARGLDEAMRVAIRDNGGTPVEGKTLGDGVLAVFQSAKQAITCAQACHDAASAAGLALHAGIHAGDVIREADNVYGGAVNIAARISALSAPGETLVSGTVRDLARTSADVTFEDRGEQALKGVGDSVRLFAVG